MCRTQHWTYSLSLYMIRSQIMSRAELFYVREKIFHYKYTPKKLWFFYAQKGLFRMIICQPCQSLPYKWSKSDKLSFPVLREEDPLRGAPRSLKLLTFSYIDFPTWSVHRMLRVLLILLPCQKWRRENNLLEINETLFKVSKLWEWVKTFCIC